MCSQRGNKEHKEAYREGGSTISMYLVFHEQNEPRNHNVDCIPQARILEKFGNLTSRETRKDQS